MDILYVGDGDAFAGAKGEVVGLYCHALLSHLYVFVVVEHLGL